MTPDTIIVVVVIAIATTVQIAGLVFIAFQVRRMNDKMIADDASIFQGRQGQEILREMREMLRNQS
jgi:predicted DNA repair protein MutK